MYEEEVEMPTYDESLPQTSENTALLEVDKTLDADSETSSQSESTIEDQQDEIAEPAI